MKLENTTDFLKTTSKGTKVMISYLWRGKNVVRSMPQKKKDNPSPAQIEQRKKFALVNQFVCSFKELVNIYFDKPKGVYCRLNRAVSYHLLEAVAGTPGNYSINYQKVLFSKGTLERLDTVTCKAEKDGILHFTYHSTKDNDSDKLIVLIYDTETKTTYYNRDFAVRKDMNAKIMLNPNWTNKPLHLWLAMTNKTEKRCSVSQYLREITLS